MCWQLIWIDFMLGEYYLRKKNQVKYFANIVNGHIVL